MFAGVDTHKDTLAVAVINDAGRVVTQLELPNQDSGYVQLLALLTQHAVTWVGIEGSGNYGRPAAMYLVDRDVDVVEVPPLMTSRNGEADPARARPTRSTRSRSPASPPAKPRCRRSGR